MSIQNKPDYKVFASDAKSGEVETFPDILRGWGVTIDRTGETPPMEWFNAIGKRADEWLLYLTQRGIPEWDSSLDYPKSAMVMLGDVFYVSLKQTKNENPTVTQQSWKKLSDFLGVDSKLGKEAIVQYGGANEDVVMSQKAVTDAINGKPDVTQTTGASTTLVMSQNAVTELAAKKVDKLNAEINNTLTITSNSDYATINLKKKSGDTFSIDTAPDSLDDAVKFFYKRADNAESINVSLRKKSGVIALVSDIPSSVTKVEDVTSQREAGVTYVNSNSHTIFVMLESYGSVSQASIFTLDGVSMTWITSGAQYGNVTSATIPVPAGSSYSSGEFKKWVEIS